MSISRSAHQDVKNTDFHSGISKINNSGHYKRIEKTRIPHLGFLIEFLNLEFLIACIASTVNDGSLELSPVLQEEMPLQHSSRCWSCVLPMFNDLRLWVCFCIFWRTINFSIILLLFKKKCLYEPRNSLKMHVTFYIFSLL